MLLLRPLLRLIVNLVAYQIHVGERPRKFGMLPNLREPVVIKSIHKNSPQDGQICTIVQIRRSRLKGVYMAVQGMG